MPRVVLTYKYGRRPLRDEAEKIAKVMPTLVAEALSTTSPEGKLTSEDVMVCVRSSEPGDINVPPLAIEIDANSYKERKENLQERVDLIVTGLRAEFRELPKRESFVWVRLSDAAFAVL